MANMKQKELVARVLSLVTSKPDFVPIGGMLVNNRGKHNESSSRQTMKAAQHTNTLEYRKMFLCDPGSNYSDRERKTEHTVEGGKTARGGGHVGQKKYDMEA